MKHKTLFLLCILVAVIMLASCSTKETETANVLSESTEESSITEESVVEEVSSVKVPEEIPTISIKSGETEIPYVTAMNQWNGRAVKRMSLFDPSLTQENFPNPPIVPTVENNIVVNFGEYPPENISVTEQIIHRTETEDRQGTIRTVTFEEASEGSKTDGIGIYVYIPELPEEAPNTGEIILTGYSITAYWGDNICEYGFIVKPVGGGEIPREVKAINVPEEIPDIAIVYIIPTMRSYMQGETEGVTNSETSGVGQYEENIPYLTARTEWNGAMYKRLPITEIVKSMPAVEVKVPQQNETTPCRIQIDFGEYPPEIISAVQYITVAGVNDSPEQEMCDCAITKISDSVYEIKISDIDFGNYTDLPDEPYQPEVIISLNVSWGKNVCEYGFTVTLA